VVYFVLAASAFLLVSALTALRPGRHGALKVLAFPVGWAAGELPVQAIIAQGALVAIAWWWSWPSETWQVVALWVLGSAVLACNLALAVIQFHSRTVVRRSLANGPVRPIAVGQPSEDRFSSWWRTLLQVPFHPRRMLIARNVAYGPAERHRLDIWRMPETAPGAPVILYVHGGAWVIGDKREQGRPMLHELVARGWVAVTMNYRLAPKFPWPAQIEDVTRALGWVKAHIAEHGGDPSRVAIAGGSAGGHLAALLALTVGDPSWRPDAEADEVGDWSVRACVPFYGVLEMTGDESVWRGHGRGLRDLLERRVVQRPYVGHEDLYRAMSPLDRIGPDAPPFLVIQGDNDTLVDVNVARSFVAALRERGSSPVYYIELPFTQHAFDVTASPRTSATTRAVAAFLEATVGAPAEPGEVSSPRA
jgi:acetyl esterase/lipase